MKPNIFQIAAELRAVETYPRLANPLIQQYAFFIWLLQWADKECAQYDAALHAVAQNFVRTLLDKSPEYSIQKIITEITKRRSQLIIGTEVNNQYYIGILIEKPRTQDSNLSSYLLDISDTLIHKVKPWLEPKVFFAKTERENLRATENTSSPNDKKSNKKDYKIIDRKEVLRNFSKANVSNNRFKQFVSYWESLETLPINPFTTQASPPKLAVDSCLTWLLQWGLTWLLQWGNEECAQHDAALHTVAQDFIRLLLEENPEYPIQKVIVRQANGQHWISAKVNEHYLIAIADKRYIDQDSNLTRYHTDSKIFEDEPWLVNKRIYLGTNTDTKNYTVMNRKEILNCLSGLNNMDRADITDDTFRQFIDYWTIMQDGQDGQDGPNSLTELEQIKSNPFAAQDFLLELENLVKQESQWKYLHSSARGFWAYEYYRQKLPKLGDIYIEIDNDGKGHIELLIKIDIKQQTKTSAPALEQLFNEIEPFAKKHGLTIRKPQKQQSVTFSQLAIVNEAFQETADGYFNFAQLSETLKNLEAAIDEYCQRKAEIFPHISLKGTSKQIQN